MKSLLLFALLVLRWTSVTAMSYKRQWRTQGCDDIAIIGAGIAGTYTGWRLRNLGKKITIYEYSDRVGGRFYTHKFPKAPDINIELGAMRFIPDEHPLFNDLLHKLRLPVQRFEQGSGPTSQTLMYLRGKHLRYDSLGGHDTPYNLGPNERKHVELLSWETYKNGTNADEVNLPEADKKYYIKTADEVELYKQSIISIFQKTLSTEAINYMKGTRPFPSASVGEISSSFGYTTSPKPSNNSASEVLTVTSGFSSVTSRLLEQFLQASTRHKVKLNRHLRSLKKRRGGGYKIYFEPTVSYDGYTKIDKEKKYLERYCARKVVLAINRLALERLDWSVLNQPKLKDLITNSVRDIPVAKIYACYPYPWWEQSPVYNVYSISDTPLQQTYGMGTSNISPHSSVLLSSYSDVATSLWRELVQRNTEHQQFMNSLNFEVISLTHKYLSRMYKISPRRIPSPSNGVVAIWDSYPFGGAVQLWNPGYIWEDVEKTMVKPSSRDDVFIVSNAFNSRALSIWSEGALQAVELAMSYLNPKNKH